MVVHLYKSVKREKGQVKETCDDIIYKIIEKKKDLVQAAESALRKVSIDHFLIRKMYSNKTFSPPPSPKSVHS